MKLAKETMFEIIDHIKKVADGIKGEEVNNAIQQLLRSKRVFIYGAGRSGLVGKAFAVRLAHLGFNVFVIGETITPGIEKGDTFLAISGSGETLSVVVSAEAAKDQGAKVTALTSNPNSRLAKIANFLLIIKGRTKIDIKKGRDYLADQVKGQYVSLSPLGTLFEDTCQVFLDGVIVELMHRLGKTEKDLMLKHATVE